MCGISNYRICLWTTLSEHNKITRICGSYCSLKKTNNFTECFSHQWGHFTYSIFCFPLFSAHKLEYGKYHWSFGVLRIHCSAVSREAWEILSVVKSIIFWLPPQPLTERIHIPMVELTLRQPLIHFKAEALLVFLNISPTVKKPSSFSPSFDISW